MQTNNEYMAFLGDKGGEGRRISDLVAKIDLGHSYDSYGYRSYDQSIVVDSNTINLQIIDWDTAITDDDDVPDVIAGFSIASADRHLCCLFFDPYDNDALASLEDNLNKAKQQFVCSPDVKIDLIAICEEGDKNRVITKEQAEQFVSENSLNSYYEVSRSVDGVSELTRNLEQYARDRNAAHKENKEHNKNKNESKNKKQDTSPAEYNANYMDTSAAVTALQEFSTWIDVHCKKGNEDHVAARAIIDILNGIPIHDKSVAKKHLTANKKTINDSLKILQKSSYGTTAQNALATVAAFVSVVGWGALLYNYCKYGNAGLFFTEGNKQKAERAINLARKDADDGGSKPGHSNSG